jgi:nitrogen fixation protein NifQ
MWLARKPHTRPPEPFMDISTTSQTRAWQAPRTDLVRAALDEEHADLMALLRTHASHPGILADHLAMALAQACMGPRHLWEDLGLANRGQLNALMAEHFTALHQRNVQNMRWKKFFYRLLCEQADVLICKSPHCSQCEDQPVCFDSGV